jgi:hypothetical protein
LRNRSIWVGMLTLFLVALISVSGTGKMLYAAPMTDGVPAPNTSGHHIHIPLIRGYHQATNTMKVDIHLASSPGVASIIHGAVYVVPFGLRADKTYSLAPTGNGPGFPLDEGLQLNGQGTVNQNELSNLVVTAHREDQPVQSGIPFHTMQDGSVLIPAGAFIGTYVVSTEVGAALIAGTLTLGVILLAVVAVGLIAYAGYLIYEDIKSNQSAEQVVAQLPADQPDQNLALSRTWAQAASAIQSMEEQEGAPVSQTIENDVAFPQPPQDPCQYFKNLGNRFPNNWTVKVYKNYNSQTFLRVEIYNERNEMIGWAKANVMNQSSGDYIVHYVSVLFPYARNYIGTILLRMVDDLAVAATNNPNLTVWVTDRNKFGVTAYDCYRDGRQMTPMYGSVDNWTMIWQSFFDRAQALGLPDYLAMLPK